MRSARTHLSHRALAYQPDVRVGDRLVDRVPAIVKAARLTGFAVLAAQGVVFAIKPQCLGELRDGAGGD